MSGVPLIPGVSGGLCVQSVVTHLTDGTSWLGGRRLEAPIPCHIYQQWFAVLFSFLQPPQKAPLLHPKCKTSAKPSFPRPKPSINTPDGPHQGSCPLTYSSTTLQTLLEGRGRCQHGIISRNTRSDSHFAFLLLTPRTNLIRMTRLDVATWFVLRSLTLDALPSSSISFFGIWCWRLI